MTESAHEEAPRGVDVARVTEWFRANVPGVRPPLGFELFAGGHSNITYKVTDAAGEVWVLRRPPLHHVLATAHDMGREFRIISGLGPTAVPVPPAVGFCEDTSVNGAPFYVMRYVPGAVLHDAEVARSSFTVVERRAAGEHFVDVLSDLHDVDPDAVGLGTLGKKEGYVARQLKRWYSQWTQSKTRELPSIDRVYDILMKRIPEQARASVVHGDYRLGNCITQKPGRIAAVLDWEISTLGDPLADLGYVLATWEYMMTPTAPEPPSVAEGFPTADEVLHRYAKRSGRDVSQIDFYTAFSFWKSACIVEGVYARYLGGALGETDVKIHAFKGTVDRFAELADERTSRIGETR